MSSKSSAEHLSPETLADYYLELLPEEAAMRVEDHLLECASCTQLAHRVQRAAELVDDWTAHRQGLARVRAAVGSSEVVARALAAVGAREADPALRERLARWARRWQEQGAAAAQVIMAAPGRASRILSEGFPSPGPSAAGVMFARVSAPAAIRGARGAPSPADAAVAELGVSGSRAEVEVSSERRDIVVRVAAPPAGQALPLVLLADARGRAPTRLESARRYPGVSYLLAQFEGIDPGEYVLTLEPGGDS